MNDMISSLGPDVELTSEKMEKDPWADKMLREIGKILTTQQQNAGQDYLGSFAFHLFADSNRNLKGQYQMGSITQIAVDDVAETLATLAFNNGVIALRKYFKPSATSGRRGDKR